MSRTHLNSREVFCNAFVSKLPQELESIEKSLSADELAGIQLGRSEGALLSLLTALKAPRVAVEIGGLYGASASWTLKHLPPQSRLITLEKSEERANVLSEKLSGSIEAGRLEVLVGDAQQELWKLPSDLPVDMVFIDADKGGYPAYLKWAEERLSPGGLLVADNTFLFGAILGEGEASQKSLQAMKEFNEHLKTSDRWFSVFLPTTEGLTLALRQPK